MQRKSKQKLHYAYDQFVMLSAICDDRRAGEIFFLSPDVATEKFQKEAPSVWTLEMPKFP